MFSAMSLQFCIVGAKRYADHLKDISRIHLSISLNFSRLIIVRQFFGPFTVLSVHS